eukprot:1181924-Prorocentrum_minimum.AAC.3
MGRSVVPMRAALICALIGVCVGQTTVRSTFSGWTDADSGTLNTLNSVDLFEPSRPFFGMVRLTPLALTEWLTCPCGCWLYSGKMWAAGNFDTVCYSTDGGQSWVQKPTLRPEAQWKGISSTDFCYPNPDTRPGRFPFFCDPGRQVWVVGDYGYIAKTTDYGATWLSQSGNIEWVYQTENMEQIAFITFHSVHNSSEAHYNASRSYIWLANLPFLSAVDMDTAYIAGDKATLLKTTNGGTTWTSLNSATANGVNLYQVCTLGHLLRRANEVRETV